jgi:hypothetical protein
VHRVRRRQLNHRLTDLPLTDPSWNIMNLKTLLASSSLLALSLTACGGGSTDGVAKGADQKHISRAFAAATADYVFPLLIAGAYTDLPAGTACPKVTQSADQSHVEIKGGCDTDDGRIDGSITLDVDRAAKKATVVFDSFKLSNKDDPEGDLSFDGTMSITDTSVTVDASISLFGIASQDNLSYQVSGSDAMQTLTIGADSSVDVDGMGSFDASGSYSFGDGENIKPSGKVTLTGADTLVFDLSKANAQGCFEYSIDGQVAGNSCNTSN